MSTLRAKRQGMENVVTVWIPIVVLVLMIFLALFILATQEVSGREIRNPLGSADESQYRFAFDVAQEVNYRNDLNKMSVFLHYPNRTNIHRASIKENIVDSVIFGYSLSRMRDQVKKALGGSRSDPNSFRFVLGYGPPWPVSSSDQNYQSGPATFYYLFPMPGEAAEINFVLESPSDELRWRQR